MPLRAIRGHRKRRRPAALTSLLSALGNRRGEVRVHAKLFDGLQPGVLVSHSVFPHAAYVGGLGLNALIGADVVPPNGGAAFHDTAVWVALA